MTLTAGTRVTEQLEVGGDGTTLATLAMRRPDTSVWVDVSATSPDVGDTWLASVLYDVAGIWYRRWVVTGTGAGEREDALAVGPRAGDLGADAAAYATTTDLAGFTGTAPPLDAARLLARASDLIDSMLLSARYPVDDDGLPTDTGHIAAFRKATCQQVAWWIETGDPSGAGAVFQSVSIAGVSLSRGYTSKGSATGAAARLAPDVWSTLALAGLTGHAPAVVA